ncbi:MAG: excinuclease ABC subunit UvrC [Spirochaetota bacterium]|nr:MAG: excinuclease ABC subunit UvrC [Spirochaetota bacterium]
MSTQGSKKIIDLGLILKNLPQNPGVYLMKNKDDEVIYIGKAINLKKRVLSYFQKKQTDEKTFLLIQNIASLETIITDNEVEALILESNLIKRYRPKFNIELKDNNKYPYIKITTGEEFPRIVKTRIKKNDKALYFGPYTSAKAINRTIKTITDIFPLRRCSKRIEITNMAAPDNVSHCLNYHLGKCAGPCSGTFSKDEYNKLVEQVILFLKGKKQLLLDHIKEQMEKEAEQQKFEQAIFLKERYQAIMNLLKDQKINTSGSENEDVIGIANRSDIHSITVLNKRDGNIVGKKDYIVNSSMGTHDVIEQFLDLFYAETSDIPDHILLPVEIDDTNILEKFFKDKYNRTLRLVLPKKGMRKRLIDLASKNALQKLEEEFYKYNPEKAIHMLKNVLDLPKVPHCIEAFDISTIGGSYSVASMVKFIDGSPEKKGYRKFRIRYSPKQNDVEMIAETVARRYQRLLNEKSPLPDLILIDGGKPQINSAKKILIDLEIEEIPVIGLAKKQEEIYSYMEKDPLILDKQTDALRLLIAIRNEAHRFAHSYHKQLRVSGSLSSKLATIPGIGESLTKCILSALEDSGGDITIQDLIKIRGVGQKRAEVIFNTLKSH